ncbi:MAG TPA: ATP-binding protein [Roseiflexaceae bacterium]|nr:ATP-binding protein [Roseiflexaceae bacterium]
MRSLTLKLTLAFMLVGLLGAILVAVLIGYRTRAEFDRYRSTRDQAVLVEALEDYYAARGSWAGVNVMLATRPLSAYGRDIILTDAAGVVVHGSRAYLGRRLPPRALAGATPIRVGGETVGHLLPIPPSVRPPGAPPGRADPAALFLQQVTWASAASAAIAALLALVLGVLLARTLTGPLRELTAATQALARGQLDQRVPVRSRDEVGALAASFNRMSADLARASQARKQMTADLAHDLRTPLSILRGYTEGLQDGRLAGTPALFAIMHGEVVHLQRLVEDLRLLSLADAGALPLNRRAVDPRALLERTALAHVVQAEERGIALRVEASAELPSVLVDTDRMTQVLNNLVSNALRYTPAGGTVTLKAECRTLNGGAEAWKASSRTPQPDPPQRRNEHGVVGETFSVQPPACIIFSVADTGQGIAAEDLPFVFERFYRADSSRQRADGGASGLGLAIAKAIVEAHGGAIRVESAVGRGTSFVIALPAAPRGGQEAPVGKSAGGARSTPGLQRPAANP